MLFRYFCVCLFLLPTGFGGAPVVAQTKNTDSKKISRPNILFILSDDQRWDALGVAGNDIIQTPEMDALARQGTYFSHAMVTTPICAASRASILTGLYERTHRYSFEAGPIREKFMVNSYPRLLKAAGYYTGFFGKFGVDSPGRETLFDEIEIYDRDYHFPDRRGYFYKKISGKAVHLTRYTGEKALGFIAKAPTDQPFCLSLSFSAPHAHDNTEQQYFWQEEIDSLYQNMTMPGPSLGEDAYFNELPAFVRKGLNRTRWHWRYDTPEKYQHSVKGYYRMIRGIDLEIGKIRAKLKERGLDQNTVIILMGDNGYFLGERQLAGKWLMFDNSVRVPLIVFDPREKRSQVVTDMALNIDVPATILDLAGISCPKSYHGKSLVPLVTGQTPSLQRDAVLIEHIWEKSTIPPSEGLRTAQWKYFRYVNDKSKEALYHLLDDPQESKNLAEDGPSHKTLVALRQQCERLIQKYSDPHALVPGDLQVNFVREPGDAAIGERSPEYRWTFPKGDASQQNVQILVASSREKIDLNLGDVWDSTKVSDHQLAKINHGGKGLKLHATYYWKVRIWDQDNRLSDYSVVQKFKVAR